MQPVRMYLPSTRTTANRRWNHPTGRFFVRDVRGGSTSVLEEEESDDETDKELEDEEDEATKQAQDLLRTHRLTQHIYLQSRSIMLRKALIERGLTELELSDTSALNLAKETDWDCALSTRRNPKTCLYSIDLDIGSKVIAPTNSTKWISVGALNRLRRDDPTKIDTLWHSQFKALHSWFGSDSKYALASHLPPVFAIFVTGLLDRPWLLKTMLSTVALLGFAVTLPVWEVVVQGLLMQPYLWSKWAQWARFVHAGLPMKIFFIQIFYGFASQWLGGVYNNIRGQMVEVECKLLEDCIPLTILDEDEEDEA